MKVILVSGGFDPIHSGHIKYLESAKSMGDYLIVALNSDDWLIRKKGKNFMSYEDRHSILINLCMTDDVISFEDDDIGSCIDALEKVKMRFPDDEIIFCNGGDRNKDNIPEMKVKNVNFEFGVGGGEKINSSSKILNNFLYTSEDRVWGKFFNLYVEKGIKVKNLIVQPGKGMSFQRHKYRNEIWFAFHGEFKVNFSRTKPELSKEIKINNKEIFLVEKMSWHQIFNPYKHPCHIIEIQFGEHTEEDDIERLHFYNNND